MSVAYSPDGTKIVSGSLDKTIKVWDAGALDRKSPFVAFSALTLLGVLAGTLDLKGEISDTAVWQVLIVAFSPDGSRIFHGGPSFENFPAHAIKVWDANPRPFNPSEWEEVDISGMEKDEDGGVAIEGLGYIKSNYWKNTVTGELRGEYSTAGELWASNRSKSGMQVRFWAQNANSLTELTPPPLLGSHSRAQGAEGERAQQRHHLRRVLARRHQDRLGLAQQDDQSLGCRRVLGPKMPILGLS